MILKSVKLAHLLPHLHALVKSWQTLRLQLRDVGQPDLQPLNLRIHNRALAEVCKLPDGCLAERQIPLDEMSDYFAAMSVYSLASSTHHVPQDEAESTLESG